MTIPAEPPQASTGEVIVHVFGRTDVGRTREHNEDAFLVADLSTDNASLQPEVRTHVVGPRGTLFMVADGLGGAAAGEIASELAVNTVYEQLRDRWTRSERTDPEAFATAIKSAAEAANGRIYSFALEHPEYRGLGTTATIAGLLGDTLYLAQVGDSRAYLVRDAVARQITKDQSLMQRLIEAGELTPDEAERSERRNIILQALGPEPVVKIDLTFQKLRRGDTLVLCTDGLSGLVRKDEIAEVVSSGMDLLDVCRELIDRANENGGPDNITVIAARFEGSGLADAEPDDAVGHAPFQLPGTETPSHPRHRFETARAALRRSTPREASVVDDAGDPPPRRMDHTARAWLLALASTLLLALVFLAARHWRESAPRAPAPVDTTAAGTMRNP
ncbi:MAG TPA: protein phosphatase 2C domain-containing protein [Gemmatimonadaceae bacterium]|nr:protein phosphatase 2C domain-containing protein [Gemmatimonadaceae bacterium]